VKRRELFARKHGERISTRASVKDAPIRLEPSNEA
jgi:hypothetical protein